MILLPMPAATVPAHGVLSDDPAGGFTRVPRGLVLAWSAAFVLIAFRSAMIVFQPQLAFHADQGVIGLMAKHLIQGRAFPLFIYGQNYLLGVEAWLAAPVFLVAGVSVAALKLPLLVINVAIGLLLVTLLYRESGLSPTLALIASLFFVLAPPGTAAELLAASGGNVEPFLYVLLLWLLRTRPVWFGVVLGVGFLHREFTAYGALAIVLLELISGRWRGKAKAELVGAFQVLRVVAEVWLVSQFLRQWASAAGPGTDASMITLRGNDLIEAIGKFCFDPGTVLGGVASLVTVHWSRLFGTAPLPVLDLGLESDSRQGLAWSGIVLGATMVLFAARIIAHASRRADWWTRYEFCAYLILVGAISALAIAVSRCGDVTVLRYDLLSLVGAVGLAAWGLSVESRPWIRRTEIAVLLCWALVSGVAHARIYSVYSHHPRIADKILIIRALDARGIRYAVSDYWIAYYITFFTNERIVVAADDFRRIHSYDQEVASHRDVAVKISRTACGDAKPIIDGVYFCPLD
jgi:hypothetical protein